MEPLEILEQLFDEKILKVLKLFTKNPKNQYYLREIARKARVSPASTYRILNKLMDIGALELTQIKTAKLYNLADNKVTEFLSSIIQVDVIEYFIERASQIDKVEEILLLGKKGNDKSNLLILGNGVDTDKLNSIIGEVKQQYGYTLNQMSLNTEQFEQMSSMGLYPGKKTVLYKKIH